MGKIDFMIMTLALRDCRAHPETQGFISSHLHLVVFTCIYLEKIYAAI